MTTLFKNGNIRTVDSACPTADAFVVRDGKFAYVGTLSGAREALRRTGPADQEVDLGGQAVLPAFNDSHMHFVHFAKSMRSVNLSGTKSIGEIQERIRAAVEKRSAGDLSWMEGEGWNQDYFIDEKRFPNKFDLDSVTGEVPVLIMRTCFHIGILNSAGLRALRLNRDTAPRYGNLIDLLEDGEPSGIIKENLLDTVKPMISTLDFPLIKQILCAAQGEAFAQGLTSVQSDDVGYMPGSDYDLLFRAVGELEEAGKFHLHLGEQCLLQKKDLIREFFGKGYRCGALTDRCSINCVKLLSDGSLGARTAAMRAPYFDAPETHGLPSFTQDELDGLVLTAHENGAPVAIHAIGDRAIEMSLDAIEHAGKAMPGRRFRDGIVHCQITDPALLNRFRELDVLAFIQPIFIDYDMNIVDSRVGPALAATSYAWKSMQDLGVHASFGTDCPVEKFNTMPNIYSAVTRKNLTRDAVGEKTYLPGQRMSMERAIRAYTVESAYAAGQERERGSITAGKTADFIVLDHDLFHLASDEDILKTRVLRTYVKGTSVYEA
ncbi:MAG: amidohydrolase [Oscillibacter sp.]|jgi:predicted amidohydrolase YtcJ|nr:amidohydrolase [Oscillibacter sp.]